MCKTKNRDDAIQTLKELSGNAHFVYSGFTIVYKNKVVSNYAKTKVFFEKLSNSEIGEYINTDECDDKAGAYGIQGFGAQFIKKIEGDYFTVMGFPISKFYSTLKQYPQILR
ncbi:MAG: Maf family protein [Candidatus Cloacimonadota bacterium]|nr:Maf family protein [Candidatus Cloacimonadota bacterium]